MKKINIEKFKKMIGIKTNIHKVSFFHKEDIEKMNEKRILFLDLEFSKNKYIYEIGGFIIEKNKIVELIFKEYSLPNKEEVWDFQKNSFVVSKLNEDKPIFDEKEWFFKLLDSVDYIVVHNYVAEAQCIFKLLYPLEKYDITKINYFNDLKIICTNYSFSNKYFKSKGMTDFKNSEISKYFGWEIMDTEDKLILKNKEIKFCIKKPKSMKSELHNSFYDSAITLTNFISLTKLI